MTLEEYEAAGIDTNDGLKRFLGQQAIFEKFLKKILNNDSMEKLAEAIAAQKTEDAFFYAHTLKGICGNLSLKKVLDKLVPLVEYLRSGKIDNAQKMYDELLEQYNITIAVIKQIP